MEPKRTEDLLFGFHTVISLAVPADTVIAVDTAIGKDWSLTPWKDQADIMLKKRKQTTIVNLQVIEGDREYRLQCPAIPDNWQYIKPIIKREKTGFSFERWDCSNDGESWHYAPIDDVIIGHENKLLTDKSGALKESTYTDLKSNVAIIHRGKSFSVRDFLNDDD